MSTSRRSCAGGVWGFAAGAALSQTGRIKKRSEVLGLTGLLVAAIGANDNVFKVGSKSTFRAQHSGQLKFAVAIQGDYANQNFPGKFTC